jgi:uncharacterized protein YciI
LKFILIAHDKPGGLDIRKAVRPAHLAYLTDAADKIIFGGPLLAADGSPFGSVVVIEAEDEAAARSFFEADPYATAGLFELVSVSAYRLVFDHGALVG